MLAWSQFTVVACTSLLLSIPQTPLQGTQGWPRGTAHRAVDSFAYSIQHLLLFYMMFVMTGRVSACVEDWFCEWQTQQLWQCCRSDSR
jgi:hypothetical protein